MPNKIHGEQSRTILGETVHNRAFWRVGKTRMDGIYYGFLQNIQ